MELLSVPVRPRAGSFEWGTPEVLFRVPESWITGDGERFLLREPLAAEDASSARFEVILEWESLVDGR